MMRMPTLGPMGDLASSQRSLATLLLGALVTVGGLVGTVFLLRILWFVLPKLSAGEYGFTLSTALYGAAWLALFIGLCVTGVSLVMSGLRRKRHDLVPGITLYIVGLSAIVIGFFLLVRSDYIPAVVAIVVGAIFVYLESQTRIA